MAWVSLYLEWNKEQQSLKWGLGLSPTYVHPVITTRNRFCQTHSSNLVKYPKDSELIGHDNQVTKMAFKTTISHKFWF